MNISLSYTTQTGSPWLGQIYNVDESNYKETIDSYIENNQSKAIALETKWHFNGNENIFLSFDYELFPNFPTELGIKIFEYVNMLDV